MESSRLADLLLTGVVSGMFGLVSGCADEQAPDSVSVTDSAGVRIVESHGPAWDAGSGWVISPEPSLQIGEGEGDEQLQFFNVSDGLRLPDGRIVILNSGTSTVRLYSPDGSFLAEFRGPGNGPGEFRRLSSVHLLRGDTLLIWDGARREVSFFTPAGDFVRSASLRAPGSGQLVGMEPLPDGRLVVKVHESPMTAGGDRSEGISRDPAPVLVFDREGILLDTLGVFPSTETMIMSFGGRTGIGPAPFAKDLFVAVEEDAVIVGTAVGMEVSVFDPAGTPEAVFRYPGVDLVVREEDQEWYRERMLEAAGSPEERQMAEGLLAQVIFPETRAAYSALHVGVDGTIWLRSGWHIPRTGVSTEWTVFSEEGALLGTVTLPDRFEPLEFGGDSILGVWKDEFDVEFIRVCAIDKGD